MIESAIVNKVRRRPNIQAIYLAAVTAKLEERYVTYIDIGKFVSLAPVAPLVTLMLLREFLSLNFSDVKLVDGKTSAVVK